MMTYRKSTAFVTNVTRLSFILPMLRGEPGNKARDSQLESKITNNGQENFTALKLALLGTQLQYSKIKLVDQFRSASV